MDAHRLPRRTLAQALVLALLAGLLTTLPATRADASHGPTVRISDAYTGTNAAVGTPCPCAEGNTGTRTFRFDVTLAEAVPPRTTTVEVDYVTANAGATVADGDYQATEGTLSFPPGVTSRTIDVVVNGDTKPEGDEAFLVVLTDVGANAHVGDDTGRGVIANDDGSGQRPTFSVADVSAGEGAGTLVFTVTLTRPAGDTRTYEVDASTSDGTATASTLPPLLLSDYDARNATLTFTGTDTSETFAVTVNQDTVFEGNETMFVTLSGNEVGTQIGRGRATGTIVEDEPVPAVSIGDASEPENGDDDLEFTVSMTPRAAFPVSVLWSTADSTATLADADYTPGSGTITFAAGETSKTVTVDQTGDANVEPNEVVAVVLSNPSPSGRATIGDGTGAGTITNDDTGPRALAILDASVAEGDTGSRPLAFTLRLNGYSDQPIHVTFETLAVSSGSGASASGTGQDYTPVSGRAITIPAGTRSMTTPVTVLGDVRVEADEILLGRLTLQGGPATISDGTGTGTITDDDPGITVADATVVEGDTGQRALRFVVRTSSPASTDITVTHATADGTAQAGSDYVATTGKTTIPAGATSATVDVPVRGDTTHEVDETLRLTLSAPSDGTLRDGTATGTIVDDDQAALSVDAGPDRTLDTEESATFRATVRGGDGDARITWDFGDGSPTRTGSAPSHRYVRTGTFEVTVTATDTIGSDTDRLTVTVVDDGTVRRLAGEDRVATSVAAARAHWSTAPTVLLVTAQNFPDALAASALAGVDDAPVVLTPPDSAPPAVLDLLDDLDTTRVRILGGPAAVSEGVADQLRDAGVQVTRVEGPDRFATAAAIARIVRAPAGRAVVALGDHTVPSRAWPDALSAGSYAAGPTRMPVLLTRPDDVPTATLEALRDLGVDEVDLLGGTAAISTEVEQQLEAAGVRVTRVAGETRYGTSVTVARRVLADLPAGSVRLVFATGEAFPDGLSGGGLAARASAPVVLVRPDTVPAEVAAVLEAHRHRFDDADLLGGPVAITDGVRAELADRMGG